MNNIELCLKEIYDAGICDRNKLEHFERELTDEDYEYYDLRGWKNYHPDNHIDILLPELGKSIYLRSSPDPIVEIKGIRYKVEFDFDCSYSRVYEADGKAIVLTETDLSLSESLDPEINTYYYKFFGQPRWVQGHHYPAYMGGPCYHFVTIDNKWGDNGNFNILLGIDEKTGIPVEAYFEASCH